MFLTGLMSSQRVSETVRIDFDVVLARAWEAVAATHEQQAVMFVRRLAPRLGTEEALHRYFREIAVPLQMRETVRARTVLALTPEERHRQLPDSTGRTSLRPDQLITAVRRRSRFVEETTLAVRMAAAAADEALIATHVSMALETAGVLAIAMPLDEALMQYLKAMQLAPAVMQSVFQRSMARLVDSDMTISMERDLEAASHASEHSAPRRILGLRAIS